MAEAMAVAKGLAAGGFKRNNNVTELQRHPWQRQLLPVGNANTSVGSGLWRQLPFKAAIS